MTRAQIRRAHLLEVETGYRSGSRSWARPGEPRTQYDPERTTLTERRRAKVAELKNLDRQEAKQLGLEWISERTLKRMAAQYDENGLMGLADGWWTPPLRGRRAIGDEVAEAIRAVHTKSLHRSKLSMKTKERLIHQYVREKFEVEGKNVDVPHYTTLAKAWKEWLGAEGARQRYIRSAAAVETGKTKVAIVRPGQVVALGTAPLPVKVLDDLFGAPIFVHLTLALDTYSHSVVAFRLTPVSDSSVEVAMLLRDVLLPLPMRPDWVEEMEWPYPGVPATLVAEFAGHRVAGLPFFAPETVTSDHGSVYKNHQIVQVARTLRMEWLPARAMRPTDKAACERAFAGIQSLLLELLLGLRGVDVARIAAIRLVQWVAGGTRRAAEFLGILSKKGIYTTPHDTQFWIRSQYNPVEFDSALESLAAELETSTHPLTDYRRRREALERWTISFEEWKDLISGLPPAPPPARPDLSDQKRQDASVPFTSGSVSLEGSTFSPCGPSKPYSPPMFSRGGLVAAAPRGLN
ncbi:hypothetical protein ACFWRX_09520 [Streptomyces albidoflavus]